MKKFKFEIILTEEDVEGDEFWEDALKKDSTGITDLTEALIMAIRDSNLIISSPRKIEDMIKLVSYIDN